MSGEWYADTDPVQQFWQGDKAIGSNFYFELRDYGGLVGQHFSWIVPGLYDAPSTIEFFEDTPQEVIDGVLEVFEAHDPASITDEEL